MTYCPKCGTANRDGSRFCNNCGEELSPQTHVTCPDCGTENPAQNLFCSECRGRLMPSLAPSPGAEATPTIKGLSLPTKAPGDAQSEGESPSETTESEDSTPTWLRELGASLSEEGEPSGNDPEEDPSEIPDWLQALRDSLPKESESELGDTEQDVLPGWLSEMQPEAAAAEEPEPEPPALDAEAEASEPEPSPFDSQALESEPSDVEAGEEESEPEHAAFEAEEETPDWLSQLRSPPPTDEPEHSPPVVEALEEKTPDWLAQLRSSAAAEEPESMAPALETEENGEPDWLTELRPEYEPEEPELAPIVSEAGEEQPSDQPAEPEPAASEEEPVSVEDEAEPIPPDLVAEEEELPDWLAALQPAAEEKESELTPAALEAGEEEPADWPAAPEPAAAEEELESIPTEPEPVFTEEEPEIMAPEPEPEEEELPEWLALLGAAATRAQPGVTLPGDEALEEMEMPDEPSPFQPAIIETEPEPAAPMPDIEAGEVPDWLAEHQPDVLEEELAAPSPIEEELTAVPDVPGWLSDLPEGTPAPGEPTVAPAEEADWLVSTESDWQEDEILTPAEIPAWLLALKPAELREEGEEEDLTPVAEELPEETGLLAGLQGTLPVEMAIAQPRAVTMAEVLEPAIIDSPQARLFADVVGRSPEATPKEIAATPPRGLTQVARWIIYAALIIAVSLPLILGTALVPHSLEPTQATIDMHDTIESLGTGSAVLVAFDYDPATSDEMNPLAQTLVGHLMDKGASVVAVSLLPAGPATAQAVLDALAAERPDYAGSYGQRYANLGYIPGQASAVRLLALSLEAASPNDFQGTPLVELPVLESLTSAPSFDLIVDLAPTQDSLRWWIEQASTPYDIPLATGSSASVAPFALPYYETESQQLVGMISGVPGAATYGALVANQSSPPEAVAARLDALVAGSLVMVVVLLIGNVIYLSQRGSGRER